MIYAALAAGLALTMTVTAFADEPYTAYNYDYWDDAIPSQSAYRVEKTVTGTDMGLDRLSDPSDPLYISDDAPAKLSDAKDLFYDQDNDTFWVCDSGNNRILRLDTDLKVTGCYTGRRISRSRRSCHFEEVFQKRLDAEVCKSRAKEHRRKLTLSHLFDIELIACAIEKLDIIAES